jgi:tripartite-type tricarboxylate transporter receptor subunit TctC
LDLAQDAATKAQKKKAGLMRKCSSTFVAVGILLFTSFLMPGRSDAETAWPTRSVKLILPVVPGGGIDTLSRILQNGVSERLGRPLIIENRPSNAYIIGTELVARATDEHTIGMILVGTHAANPTVQGKLPYDTFKDFAAIINLTNSPNVISVHPSQPAKTLADLVAQAKAAPGQLFYASSGIGGGQHFAGEMLKQAAGIDMVHVPYKGSGASIKDAVSGEIKVIFGNVISSGPYITQGSLRALAVTSLKRSPILPDVPTLDELGYKGFEVDDNYGIIGPASLKPEIIKKIHDAFRDTLLDPALEPRLRQQGIFPHILGPEAFTKFIENEASKLHDVAIKANIKAE